MVVGHSDYGVAGERLNLGHRVCSEVVDPLNLMSDFVRGVVFNEVVHPEQQNGALRFEVWRQDRREVGGDQGFMAGWIEYGVDFVILGGEDHKPVACGDYLGGWRVCYGRIES